jgi:hypothetical protein
LQKELVHEIERVIEKCKDTPIKKLWVKETKE